jgi:hypothetical protein
MDPNFPDPGFLLIIGTGTDLGLYDQTILYLHEVVQDLREAPSLLKKDSSYFAKRNLSIFLFSETIRTFLDRFRSIDPTESVSTTQPAFNITAATFTANLIQQYYSFSFISSLWRFFFKISFYEI